MGLSVIAISERPSNPLPGVTLNKFLRFFAILYFTNLGQWAYVSIFVAGLALSALLPLMITLAGVVYPQMAGTVIGSVKVAIPIGGILMPFLMSVLASQASLQVALLIFPLAMTLAFILLLNELRRLPALEEPVS